MNWQVLPAEIKEKENFTMKHGKQLFAAMLALLMLLSIFTGCADQKASTEDTTPSQSAPAESEQTPAQSAEAASSFDVGEIFWSGDPADVYTLDLLCDDAPIACSTDTTLGKYIYDKFGIVFNYVSFSGDIEQQQAMMLAGGDYNELMYMQGNTIAKQYMDAGVLLNLDDYQDILPDFYSMWEESIPYWRSVSSDGKLYKWDCRIPQQGEYFDMMVRSDVLEYYGWPTLVSTSDWLDFLEQALKDFPTTYDGQATVGMAIPMAESWGLAGLTPTMYEKGSKYLPVSNDWFTYNAETEAFEEMVYVDDVKDSYKFFHEAYQRGILDEECFTDTCDNLQQKMNNGSAISIFYVSWLNGTANEALTEAGHEEMSYIHMPIQSDAQIAAGEGHERVISYTYDFQSWAVTDKCKDPQRLLTFINWCSTDEAQLLFNSGIEGIHYTLNEDGVRQPTDAVIEAAKAGKLNDEGLFYGGATAFRGLPLMTGNWTDGQKLNLFDTDEFDTLVNGETRERYAYSMLGWSSSSQWWDENAAWVEAGYSSTMLDPASDMGQIGTKMTEVRVKYSGQLIVSEDFDAVWSQMMDEYELLDHEAVLNALNAQLEELKAAD